MKIKNSIEQKIFYLFPFIGVILTAFVYLPTVHYGFLFDDVPNIMKFYDIRHATLADLFFSRSRWFSAWLNTFHYSFGKFDPFSYRLGNIIMHCCSGLIIFFIFFLALKRLKSDSFFYAQRISIAAFTSLFFLLHPVQTQTISYVIQGQLEGLAGFFIFSMVLNLLILVDIKNWLGYMLACILFFSLALFSIGTKEIAIISPALLIVVDWFFIAQGEITSLKKRALLHISVAVLVWGGYLFLLKPTFFINLFTQRNALANNIGNQLTQERFDTITRYDFFISQFKVILHYLWIFLWPANISADYDEKLAKSFFCFETLVPFLFLLTLICIILKLLKTNKTNLVAFAFLWFFIVILPRSSIIPATELIADYKTYIPSVGIFFLLSSIFIWVIQNITNNLYKKGAACLISILILSWSSYNRNQVWQSGEVFWADVIKKAPHRARAYNNYGAALLRQKKIEDSIAYFKKAIELDKAYADPWSNLSLAYRSLGQYEHAFKTAYHALDLRKSPENYHICAGVLMKLGKYETAEQMCLHALEKYRLRTGHEYGRAWTNLGECYTHLHRHEEAWKAYEMACMKADMDTEVGFITFGKKSLELEKFDHAIVAFEKAYKENPAPKNLYLLGQAYYKAHKYEQAEAIFEQLIDFIPEDEIKNILRLPTAKNR